MGTYTCFSKYLAEETESRLFVALPLNQDVNFIPILVYSSPKVVLFTSNVDKNLIQIPDVTNLSNRLAQLFRIGGRKFKTPLSDSFATDHHTSGSKKFFDISVAQ